MPCLYEIIFEDRKEKGLKPYKYSGSNYSDNKYYFGSSQHKDYKNHLNEAKTSGKLTKNIINEWLKEEITIKELRKLESDWQKSNNHKSDETYYNMCDSPHPVIDDPLVKKKISETLKKKGISPYIEGVTNSKENIEKAKQTKKIRKHEWWHCPTTLKNKFIPTGIERIPKNWERGQKPKKPKILSDRTKPCNLGVWEVYKNDELFWEGENLHQWCKSNDMMKLKVKISGVKVLSKITKIEIKYSENKTIIENHIDTLLNGQDYAKKVDKSKGYISKSLKKGFYEIKEYDFFQAKQIKKT